jgi:hypothetical protein
MSEMYDSLHLTTILMIVASKSDVYVHDAYRFI